MSERRKTPQQKKAESYKKDRIYLSRKLRNGSNRALQRNKRAAEHSYRNALYRTLQRDRGSRADEYLADAELHAVRRKKLQLWEPIRLAEWVQRQQSARLGRTAHNVFKFPYDSTKHRARFLAFLTSLTEGRSAYASRLASEFAHICFPDDIRYLPADRRVNTPVKHVREWLDAFFRDEPEWEPRLREWIARMTAAH